MNESIKSKNSIYSGSNANMSFSSLLATDHIGSRVYGHSLWDKQAQVAPPPGPGGQPPQGNPIGADNNQFEQDFSKLAFMFVQDRAAALMPYMLGFEVVQRAEDGSRAVGIFGFKIGDDYYYIPAFFLNNQVKGVDTILNKRTNNFMPLTEEWIDHILSRQRVELGSSASNAQQLNGEFENPDFDFLQRPTVGPLGGANKMASDKSMLVPSSESNTPWSLKEAWSAMKTATRISIEKDAEFDEAWAGFVNACKGRKCTPSLATTYTKSASYNNPVKKFLEDVAGPRGVQSLMKSFEGNIKFASAALSFYPSIGSFYTDNFSKNCYMLSKERKAIKEAYDKKANIVVTSKSWAGSDSEDRQRIVSTGFSIKDNRSEDKKSDIFLNDFNDTLNAPDKPGLYSIFLASGEFVEGFVLDNISKKRAVYFAEPKYIVTGDSILTKGPRIEGSSAIMEKAIGFNSLELGKVYLFVSSSGECVGPFRIDSVIKEDGKRTKVTVSHANYAVSCCDEDPEDNLPGYSGDFAALYRNDRYHNIDGILKGNTLEYTSSIEFASHKGNVTNIGTTLVMPSDWKALPVLDTSELSYEHHRAIKSALKLGTVSDITRNLIKKGCHFLDTYEDMGSYYFKYDNNKMSQPMNYKQASVALVTRLGLRPKAAFALLDKTASDGKQSRMIKFAQVPEQFVGVDMPLPPEQTAGVNPYTGLPEYEMPYIDETEGSFAGMPEAQNADENGANIGGEMERNQEGAAGAGTPPIDEEARQLAEQAAALGQKKVFDHAAIGGLSKVYDTSAVVDSYLPEFSKTLDRLGRILFLYYWKHDDFVERYGTDDVVEMEDLLRSTFKSLGKLTLDLKQKAIGSEDPNAVTL